MTPTDPFHWHSKGNSRTPYRVMSDPEVYQAEQKLIFHGPVWNYLCLEAELPEPGCYRTTYIGETPIIVTRDQKGDLHALVNRCSHKGAMLCVEAKGRTNRITCLYHAWGYELSGELCFVAFQNGVNGKGGMGADFEMSQHGLEPLRIESFFGVIFGTFSSVADPLGVYLGPSMSSHLVRIFHKPVEVLGYHHQVMHNNWKLYMENSRDSYHLNRLAMDGGAIVDHGGWHSINYSKGATLREGEYEGSGMRAVMEDVGLADPQLLTRREEFADGITVAIQSIFPTCINQQIYNTLALRQLVPLGPDKCELHWTCFGYKDDDPELRAMRLTQANLIGPAGFVSMEDGAIGEYVQRGIAGSGRDKNAVLEMGGKDFASAPDSRATETTVRGFWQGYRTLMNFHKDGL
jgi:anthranilate 1,2-dioxygenase large subunit